MSGGTGFFGSPVYKKVMSKVYGWGAAVAILGALFKIQHYPGAGYMLTIGLGAEVLIFFLSAFEPPHEMPDWSLVYPELVGLEPRNTGGAVNAVSSSSIDLGFNQSAKLDPNAISKLNDGVNSFSQSISGLGDIGVATTAYLTSLKSASGAVNSLTEAQTQTAQNIRQSSDALSQSYVTAAKAVADSGMKVANDLAKSGDSIMENLAGTNKSLSAINSVYELHLSSINAQVTEVNKLSQTLGELNTIYGNMLNVMGR